MGRSAIGTTAGRMVGARPFVSRVQNCGAIAAVSAPIAAPLEDKLRPLSGGGGKNKIPGLVLTRRLVVVAPKA